jgi:hypothetical protein
VNDDNGSPIKFAFTKDDWRKPWVVDFKPTNDDLAGTRRTYRLTLDASQSDDPRSHSCPNGCVDHILIDTTVNVN